MNHIRCCTCPKHHLTTTRDLLFELTLLAYFLRKHYLKITTKVFVNQKTIISLFFKWNFLAQNPQMIMLN